MFFLFLACFLFSLILIADEPPSQPGAPQLLRNGFNRIEFSWTESTDDLGVAGYKIYRDGNYIASTTLPKYNDTTVAPGITYVYTIMAYDDASNESPVSEPLTVRTMENPTFEGAELVKQVVDMSEPWGLTAEQLITAVQDILLQLQVSGIEFTQINPGLLADLIESQYAIISEPQEPVSDSQRIQDQDELDQLLTDNFPGHSFLDIYLYLMLTTLGENHWQNNYPEAAETLYNLSLEFLPDHEISVFNVLCRLGQFKTLSLSPESNRAEIASAVHSNRDELMRFFDFFPDSVSEQAQNAFVRTSAVYFMNFSSLLLPYDQYDFSVFTNALSAAQCAVAINPSAANQRRLERISSWELNTLRISFLNENGGAMEGTISVQNTSSSEVWPFTPAPSDNRLFSLDGSTITVPIFNGHSYDLLASISVFGGPSIKYRAPKIPHSKGKKIIYAHGQSPRVEDLADPAAPCEVVFISHQPNAPYNLSAQKSFDTFTLSWDWALIPGFELKEFKVYRSGNYIGTTNTQMHSGIPIDSPDHTYTYTVIAYDIYDLPSEESLPLDVLPDNLTEEQLSYLAWKQLYFGSEPMFDYEDPDGDGLTNLQEYLLGSNPTVAPVDDVKSTLQNVSAGSLVKYYTGTWTSLPKFSTLEPFSTVILPDGANFANTAGTILTSGISNYLYLTASSYFDAPQAGWYRFYLGSDDGSKLYVNDVLLLSNDGRHSYREYVADIYLRKGVHKLRLEYFDYEGNARLQLDWAGPSFRRTAMNGSVLWFTSEDSAILAEAIVWNLDSDRDGLTDHEETLLGMNKNSSDSDGDGLSDFDEVRINGTNPLLVDSDGDGLSDYEELFLTFSNPLVADCDNSVTTVLEMQGSDAVIVSGEWIREGSSIRALSINGSLSFPLDIPSQNVYRLEIEASQALSGIANSSFNLELLLDGSSCGVSTITTSYGSSAKTHFYLPILNTGSHLALIRWNNVNPNSAIRINAVRLQLLGGPDLDSNGIPDWIDARIAKQSELLVPPASRYSPVCIEGKISTNLDQIEISGYYIPPEPEIPLEPIPTPSINGGWFANIQLSPSAPTNFTVSFQNNAISVNKTCTWIPTNLFESEEITIRLDDSLLLLALPENQQPAHFSIEVEGNTIESNDGSSLPYKFQNPGEITLSATFYPVSGDPISIEKTVKVIKTSFNGNLSCIKGQVRTWSNPDIADDALLESDNSVHLFESPLSPTGRKLDIIANSTTPAFIIARLGENGPILDSAKISILDAAVPNKYFTVIESYNDGTALVEGQITLSHIPENLRIRLKIFVAGITFDDGTIERWITAEDFDENGTYKYRMLRSPTATTGQCHSIEIYQGNELIKSY